MNKKKPFRFDIITSFMSIEKSVIVIFLIDPSQKAIVSNPFRFVQTQMKSSIIPYFSYVTYKHPPFFYVA